MRFVQRSLACLVLIFLLQPSAVSAQTDVTAVLESVLDCEAAEHAAWLYGFRQLEERHTMGTERQREAAYARVADAMGTCTETMALLSAEDATEFQADVVAPWVALEAIGFETSVSDLLAQMQNVSSAMFLGDLLRRIEQGVATTNQALRATARRRLTSRELRTALLALQASINATNSDRATWQYDATQCTGADRREANARAASLTRTLTALRRNRGAAVVAVERWRRGAAREGLLQIFARVFDADTNSILEGRLND